MILLPAHSCVLPVYCTCTAYALHVLLKQLTTAFLALDLDRRHCSCRRACSESSPGAAWQTAVSS